MIPVKKIALITAALIVIVAGLALQACSGGGTGINHGSEVPDFKLPNLEEKNVSLSDFRGKVVILNFWAVSCPPCVNEMPHLQAVYDKWSDQGVEILAVNIGEDPSTVGAFVSEKGLTFPVLLDSQYKVAGKYGIQYTPTTFIIDREGKLQSQIIGAFSNPASIEKRFYGLLQ